MGQVNSVFIYSPLEFVEYIDKAPPKSKNLESFLFQALQKTYKKPMDASWQPFIDSMIHKIKCVSEGWATLPKIHFEAIKRTDGTYLPKVTKIMDAV